MATVHLASAVKDACLTPLQTAIDAGAGAGTISIYTGTMPATTATAVTTQVLLGTLTFSDPCGTTSAGTLTMSAITQDTAADASGAATWARIADSTGAAVMDIDVSTTGGVGAMQLNTVNIVTGGPITMSSFTISL